MCDKHGKTFWNSTNLSNGINDITGEYFKVTSVSIDPVEFNTINFNGFQINKPFLLSISGSPDFKPRVIFHCGYNIVNIKKLSLGDNIILLCINATGNQKINIGLLGDNSKSKLILIGSVVPFGLLNVGRHN